MSTIMVIHKQHVAAPSLSVNHIQSYHNVNNSESKEESLLAISNADGTQITTFLMAKDENQSPTERALGYGAFGVVWSVVDPRDGAKVALKRIPRVFHNSITAKRVYRELKMLWSLKHENIISLIDIVKTDIFSNEIYIICELMQTDLHKIIVSNQSLSSDHVKIFLYQILRGLKYLHSAHIIHRDIKPGNMLVNSNCLLKICDFGLARIDDSTDEHSLTQEVVTQYYRPPELLMESTLYSYAVDIWSVGCTFAELLGRKILFQARSPLEQLDLIMNITGTPSTSDLANVSSDARHFVLTRKPRHPNLAYLYTLGPNVTDYALHLLSRMLRFNPDRRITAADALKHCYLEEASLRYHSCMCMCCTSPSSSTSSLSSGSFGSNNKRQFCSDLDPVCHTPLTVDMDESCFRETRQAKQMIWELVSEYHLLDNRPFRIILNRHAKNYRTFVTSSVAQAKDSRHPQW